MKTNLISRLALALFGLVALLCCTGPARAQKIVGINDHVIWRANADQDVAFAQYAQSNTKFLRVDADWNVLEPTDGVYNTGYLGHMDYFFQKCTAANIRVTLCVAYAPSWASTGNSGNQGGYAPTAAASADYADFCEFLLRRYATSTYSNGAGQHTLEAIEIWNEPDLSDVFFKPYARQTAAGATAYGNLVVAAGGRLKSVRASIGASDVLVLAPVISNVHNVCWAPTGQTTWMDAFYMVPNVTSNYDVFDWHTYWESTGSWLPATLPPCWNPANQRQAVLGQLIAPDKSEIWAKIVSNGDDQKPNWCTEIGGAAKSNTPNHNPGRLLSFAEQQTHLTDAIATLRSGNVSKLDRIYWYELFDEPNQYKNLQQAYFGLIALNASNPITYTGSMNLSAAGTVLTPKAAYAVYQGADKGAPGISFSDDFNDGNSDGWTATPGTWAVVNSQYVSPHTANVAITSVGDAAWKNYAAQAKLKFSNAWKSAGLIARYNGSAGYYLRVDVSSTITSYNLRLLKGTTIVATANVNNLYDFQNFHTVKISVKDEAGGTRILGFIDNNQLLNYLDTSAPYAAGQFALRSEPWTGTITADDVTVTSN